jgi:hypothetical protein
MNAPIHPEQADAAMPTREQVTDLLCRYPKVSDAEARLIVRFLRTGRHLDVGMLTGDEALKPQLERFMDEHGKHLRVGASETAAVVATIAGLLLACWIIWETIKPGSL